MNRFEGTFRRDRDRGVILFVTLVILLMTGLLAAGLNFYTRSQLAASRADRNAAQATEAANAALIQAAALLLDGERADEDLTDNPELFKDVLVADGNIQWYFTVLRDRVEDDDAPAYGITDESAKLNLIVATAQQLMMLPGMTPEIADAIIDWRDRDDTPGPQGAEGKYYEQLAHPYSPKNGPFESVDELLLVRGVTELLLYGEDLNRNGLLDANENDGDKSLPPDNADGRLDSGWYRYLTVYSIDQGRAPDGSPKLNINGNADQVYDLMVKAGFSQELSQFVREARSSGVRFSHPAELLGFEREVSVSSGRGGRSSRGGRVPSGASAGDSGQTKLLVSPLTPEELPKVLEELSTSRRGLSLGKVNPSEAPKPVLMAIGFTDAEADDAISKRAGLSPEQLHSYAWLISENVLSAERLWALAPRLIGRGSTFRIDAVGYSPQLGLFQRIETVLDVSSGQPRTLYSRDLTGLGPAYVLGPENDRITISGGR